MQTSIGEPLFLRACRQKPATSTPVWFMRQAGRYMPEYRKIREKHTLLEICKTPELATFVTLLPVNSLGVDAAILFADLLLPLEALGIPFHFAEGEGPVIDKPISSSNDVKGIQLDAVEEKLGYVLTAILHVKQALEGTVPLIGFAGAPFTLASYLIEGGHSNTFLKTKQFMVHEPEAWHDLMDKITRITKEYLLAQIEAGADAVQLFDSWVGALTPDDYRHFVLPYSSAILRDVAKTKAPALHFGTGTAGMLDAIRDAGGDVVGIDWRIPLNKAWKVIGYEKGIQGNLDPALLFAPQPYLKKQVESILEKAEGRPGHIFNLGHGILPGTPVDNVKYVVACVKEYQPSPVGGLHRE